ncbi:MAG: oligosaccharide repeat unit polymerase [Propionibacteriaceae bacterium]|jgi:oligosaccharide repeat unit polymerase|nr:oligosaccharide repeat unit polymerase [Propionibacteriaceae bacterium]
MTVLLLVGFAAAFAIALAASRGDIMSPASTAAGGFLLSALAFSLLAHSIKVELSGGAVGLLMVGLAAFLVGSIMASSGAMRQDVQQAVLAPEQSGFERVGVANLTKFGALGYLVVMADILITVLLLVYVQRLSGEAGLTEAISTYRTGILESSSAERRIPVWLQQAQKITTAFSVCYLYLFIYRRVVAKLRGGYVFLIPTLFNWLQGIFLGGRLQIIRSVVLVVVVAQFLSYLHNKNFRVDWSLARKSISWSLVRKLIRWVPAGVILFYGLRELIGRQSTEGIGLYFARYIGGSIACLNTFLEGGSVVESRGWGVQTFRGVYDFLSRYVVQEDASFTLPWAVAPDGTAIGNVYTAFWRYYVDFGWAGVILLSLITGILFGGAWKFLMGKVRSGSIPHLGIMIYGFVYYCVPLQAIESYFYISAMSFNTVSQILMIAIAWVMVAPRRQTARGAPTHLDVGKSSWRRQNRPPNH